ncbi:GSCOCG00006875001-RA-CDS [Cotesia congregata]|nr:GSCOCG00006875001-RA-CDS [Cotesia congregata]
MTPQTLILCPQWPTGADFTRLKNFCNFLNKNLDKFIKKERFKKDVEILATQWVIGRHNVSIRW